VSEAARDAFALAAQRLGLTVDDLSDRIVPRLGFDEHAERTFAYGPRQFTIRLGLDLSLQVRDATGKQIKVLPSPARSDDADKAASALAEWRALKAQLKQAARLQAPRLERALINQRHWPLEHWQALFMTHPLLRPFAVNLVWRAAGEDGATVTFRPLEDGTLTNAHDEPVELPPSGQVWQAHPLELDDAERAAWQQHCADYDLKPPIAQMTRPILRVDEAECEQTWWRRYEGYALNGLTLFGRFDKAGWQRGSVQDGGMYYTIWKLFPAINVEAVLQHSGLPAQLHGEWSTTIERLAFVPAGSVQRGSYVYDDVKEDDGRCIRLGDVPPIVFSEAAGDVQVFAQGAQRA
jgi:hypothetical protein